MSKATEMPRNPFPWRVERWAPSKSAFIYDAAEKVVAGPLAASVAHLIVRAVNTHEGAIGLLEEILRLLPVGQWCGGACRPGVDEHAPDCMEGRARALLSRLDAGGTP